MSSLEVAMLPLVKRSMLIALASLGVVACSGWPGSSAAPLEQAGDCPIPPRTFDDLHACTGESEVIERDVPVGFDGRTSDHIVISSKDPQAILAGLAAYATARGLGVGSFGLSAYGSRDVYDGGVGFNRGQIYWNDGGEITVDICTEYETWSGIEICVKESRYVVANQ
jgi:hypothetical protein